MALALTLLSNLLDAGIFTLLSNAMLVWMLFRMLSRNIGARRREEVYFLNLGSRIQTNLRGRYQRYQLRKTHKFFRCTGCGNWLRVPRGKGKIQITCPRCGQRFSGQT